MLPRTRSPLHSFDVHLFTSTLPVLKLVNLQHLSLTGFDNSNTWRHSFSLSQPPAHGQGTSSLASLQQLTCNNCIGLSFILPALLSLLTVRALVIRAWVHYPSTVWAEIHTCHSIPPASLAIQDLVLVDQGGSGTTGFLRASWLPAAFVRSAQGVSRDRTSGPTSAALSAARRCGVC